MITCTRKIEWDSAHRVMRHESKCATLHGHRYTAEITCCAVDLDDVGRVVDFGSVKQIVGSWVDEHWDHTTLANPEDKDLIAFCRRDAEAGKRPPYLMPQGEPTAENIARELLRVATELLIESRSGLWVSRVRVWETPNCSAEAVVAGRE